MSGDFWFLLFASLVVFSTLSLFVSKDSIKGTLPLILVFFNIASIFVSLKGYLLAALQALINLCLVMVRFLFMIMEVQRKVLVHCTVHQFSVIFSLLGLILLFIGAGYFFYRPGAIFTVDLQGLVFYIFPFEAYPKRVAIQMNPFVEGFFAQYILRFESVGSLLFFVIIGYLYQVKGVTLRTLSHEFDIL